MSEKRTFWIGAISGAVGAIFGSLSGSNSNIVTALVGAGIALIVAASIRGLFK